MDSSTCLSQVFARGGPHWPFCLGLLAKRYLTPPGASSSGPDLASYLGDDILHIKNWLLPMGQRRHFQIVKGQ